MRDLKAVGEGNVHPSKGHGFVKFTKHEDALLALRNINNNPTLFSKDRVNIIYLRLLFSVFIFILFFLFFSDLSWNSVWRIVLP
jgi:hypothetical protein